MSKLLTVECHHSLCYADRAGELSGRRQDFFTSCGRSFRISHVSVPLLRIINNVCIHFVICTNSGKVHTCTYTCTRAMDLTVFMS